MKVEKFKVLLYLKKSGLDKSGKAPIMGRITENRTMAQFSCKLSCTPGLWNPRESRLNGKSREAVETNAKIDKLLLDINAAFDSLLERKGEFDAASVKDAFQGSMKTQMTLMKMLDALRDEVKSRIGIDRAKGTYPAYDFTCRTMREFIETKFKTKDLAFGQLTEQFIHDYENFILDEKGYAVDTVRHYLAILKKTCKRAYQEGHSERFMFQHYVLPKQTVKTPKALCRESFEKIRDVEIAPHDPSSGKGSVPLRLLYRGRLQRCRDRYPGKPVHRRGRQAMAEIPPEKERATRKREAAAGSRRPDREIS